MNICVYGASSPNIAPEYLQAARRLGELMGERGHTLVYGGGAHSVMGELARGVKSRGGRVVGVAPFFFKNGGSFGDGVLFSDCDKLLYTDTMRTRKQTMEDMSDAFIAAPGGVGTLEEFIEILTLKQLGRQNKALVLLNTAGLYEPFVTLLRSLADKGFMKPEVLEIFSVADTPEAALALAEAYDPGAVDVTRLKDVT